METNKGPELTLHPEQKEEEVVQAQPVQDLSEDLSVDYKQFLRVNNLCAKDCFIYGLI